MLMPFTACHQCTGIPFDRMLVAQALTEDLTLVTSDEYIHRYPVKWVW